MWRNEKKPTLATVKVRARSFCDQEFGVRLNDETLRLEAADVVLMTTQEQQQDPSWSPHMFPISKE